MTATQLIEPAASSSTLVTGADASFLVSDQTIPTPSAVVVEDVTDGPTKTGSEAEPQKKDWKKIIWDFVAKNWFLEGLAFAIIFAAIWPDLGKKGGYIRAEYTVTYGCVMLIFILSGLSLKTKVLIKSLADWKMHLAVQIISLGITPAIGYAVGKLLMLSPSFNETLAKGLIIACSTPTTISSNVLMTKQAGGDEAGALTNAVIGNILGVFITPSLIFAYVGSQVSGGYADTFKTLAITVVGPLFFGQLVQYFFPNLLPFLSKYVNLAILNSSMLLVLVWSVFCNTFSEHITDGLDAGSFIAIFFLDLGLFSSFSALAFWVSRVPFFKFSREATIAIVMCAATKTVALGIPIINIIYEDSPLLGIISAPLLVYHAEQLVVGAFLVSFLKKWLEKGNAADAEARRQLEQGEGGEVELTQ